MTGLDEHKEYLNHNSYSKEVWKVFQSHLSFYYVQVNTAVPAVFRKASDSF